MNSQEVCRVCLSASDELRSLHAKLYDKNKTVVETINFVANIEIKLGNGLPNKICSDCESKLNIADVFKQRCLESEGILVEHVNIKKEIGYEELPTVLSKKLKEPVEYTKKTCLSSVADNSSIDLLEIKTEDLMIPGLSDNNPLDYFIKVEVDEVHDYNKTVLEHHDDENYNEELKNRTEQDSEKLINMKKEHDELLNEVLKSSDKVASVNQASLDASTKPADHQYPITFDISKVQKTYVRSAQTLRLKFSDSIQKVTLLEIEIPKSNSSTATMTILEEKSEEDMSFNIDKNEMATHQVQLDNNKGTEHITETNQFDSIKNTAITDSVKHYPASTKCDSQISCKTEKQPNCSGNYGILSCDICEYITSTSRLQLLKSHLRAHSAAMRYSCESCLFITTDVGSLKMHVKLHTGKKPYFCNVCDKKFSHKSILDVHVRVHTGEKPYSCSICDKKFSYKNSLNVHVRSHTGEKPYFCDVCDKKFSQKNILKVHVRVHTGEKPYSCNICDKKFSCKSNLDLHVRVHTGEKPYFCNVCDKKFSKKSHLNRHVRLHTSEKPYSCNICDKKLSDKSSLNTHMRLHTGEKPYSCNVCDKKFSDISSLARHTRLHTGEKPYYCKICSKKFTLKHHLNSHERLHTGERPYVCHVCDKKFSDKSNLATHVRLHTGEKPYFCNVCDKKFSDKSNLDKHVRLHMHKKTLFM